MFILASASARRQQLLAQAGFAPDKIVPAAIDETPRKAELPTHYVKRMAMEKAAAVFLQHPNAIVLAADTVVTCGRRILPKAEDSTTARACLERLSGRRHRVYTAVCVRKADKTLTKTVMTQVAFARLTKKDINAYIVSNEWEGKAGGYAIQGKAEVFIPWINGSFSNVVGLPLGETSTMLAAFGINPQE
jgi:septum formation protein